MCLMYYTTYSLNSFYSSYKLDENTFDKDLFDSIEGFFNKISSYFLQNFYYIYGSKFARILQLIGLFLFIKL